MNERLFLKLNMIVTPEMNLFYVFVYKWQKSERI